MSDLQANGQNYLQSILRKLNATAGTDAPSEPMTADAEQVGARFKARAVANSQVVDIPFYSLASSNRQVYLNPALDALAINPHTTTDYTDYPMLRVDSVITADGVKNEMIRTPVNGQKCVIDWISVTMQAMTFDDYTTTSQPFERLRQSALINNVDKVLQDIFGFGIDSENKSGRNFYERSWQLQHDAGYVCLGGQNDTIMICINGTGCTYGKQGWEEHYHAWLNLFAVDGKITRIDLAYDDLTGSTVDIDFFDEQDDKGGFTGKGRRPNIEKRGNWKRPSGKGRTLYIGSRQSSKFCRIYEKGKQLGDPNSMWLRVEVEYKARDIFIDYDVLLNPSERFLASYPCFIVFSSQDTAIKFERIDKQNLMTFNDALALVKHQYGRYLHFFRRVFDDDSKLLDQLTDIANTKVPERIDPLTIPKMSH